MSTVETLALVNESLRMLGEVTITSFEEGTDVAATCAALAPTTIRACLTKHPWRFTLAKAQLAQLVAPPASEYRRAFALPADCLVVRQAFQDGLSRTPFLDYERFEQALLADVPALWIDYQREVPPRDWPPPFREFVRFALADVFSIPVTGSLTAGDVMHRRAYGNPAELGQGGAFREARRVDGQQQPPQQITDNPLLAARLGGSLSG
jgi:hypothetical protein